MKKGKLVLWHGGADANIPLAMVEKAHELLAGSELRVEAEEAHASLLLHKVNEFLETLKGRMS
jgi:predicted esterase